VTVENGSYTLVDKAQSFLKTTLTVQKDFAIAPQKFFSTRLFIGAFPYNTARTKGFGFTKGQMGLTANGLNDYLYDGYFLGRNETKGILSQQIQSATEGGMHFAINPDYARDGYFTNDMLATLSLKSDLPNLPSWLPLKPYMDFGYISDKRPSAQKLSESFIMSAGLALEWGDYLGIYMPLYFSGKKDDPNSFKNKATARAFTERIVFNLNLKKLNPIKLLREAGL
jgi:hypothetical protein